MFYMSEELLEHRLQNVSPDYRKMINGAEFNRHDSGSHLQKSTSIRKSIIISLWMS